jgi:pimeloyl-ACP methyl ester carboxylesterase
MRSLIGVILAVAGLYALACLGLYLAQRSLIYFPQPRRFGANNSVMSMQAGDVMLNVSTREQASRKAVIYFGGNAEDVSANLPSLSSAFPDHALYLLHYRGYGGSGGKPSEAALFADALALYDHVKIEHPDVTVIGRSLGSGPAVHLASVRPVARLVLVTPYDSIAELAAQQFPMFPVRWLLTDKFETFRYAPAVTAPTLIVAAEKDEVIPPASTSLLATRFQPGVARTVTIPAVGHNTISDDRAYVTLLAGQVETR